ncbi:MAG: gliding motility-associated C-terminal domain-containing protein [Fluviicola sp.]
MKQLFFILTFLVMGSAQLNAQCTVEAGPDSIFASCGAEVYLTAIGLSDSAVLSTNFDGGQIGAGWTTSATVLYNNPCGPSLDGTPSAWFGNVPFPRTLTTAGFDLSCGGQVCFDLDFAGDDVAGGDCEDPDLPDEGVFFQYSTNGGATWIDIFYFEPIAGYANQYYQWDNYCFTLPPGAWSTNTMFQWTQPNASSTVNDHWGIDNIEILPTNCGYYYDWSNIPGSPDSYDQTITANTTTDYIITYTDGTDACYDTVTVVVSPVNAQASAVNTNVLCPNCTDLNVEFTDYNAGSIVDDFDPGLDGNMWADAGGAQAGSAGACGSVTGNAMYFKNIGVRQAVTADVDATANCGFLQFSLFMGNTSSGAACENADAGEDIVLQYSTNGGATWTTLNTYYQSQWDNNPTWQNFLIPIPPLAQTPATRFRWHQPTFTQVQDNDAWALDNVDFTCDPPDFEIVWTPALTLNDPSLQQPTACALDTTTYFATITDTTTGCSASSSVTVNVSCPCTIAGLNYDISSCQGANTFDVTGDFIYVENPGTGTIEVEITTGTGTYTQTITPPFINGTLTNFSITGIPADGSPVDILIYFSDDQACQVNVQDVAPVPPSILGTAGSGVYCFGDVISDVTVDVTGTGPFTIDYTLDGVPMQTTSPTSPVNLGNNTGVYVVTGIADSSCSNVGNFTETIIEQAVPTVASVENGGIYCANENVEDVFVVVTGTAPFDLNYELDGSPQTINAMNDTIVLGNTPGTYTITQITDAGCSNAAAGTQTITVNPLPPVFAGNDVTLCDGESYTQSATGAQTYVWDNGTPNGGTITPVATSTYTVIGTDANGCVNTDDVTVTVEPIPQPSFVADTLSVCEPYTVYFTNTTIGNFTDCQWDFGNGNTGTGCADVPNLYEYGGNFDVTLTVTSANGCTNSVTYDDYIYVENIPSPSFVPSTYTVLSLDTDVSFDNTSTGASTYLWDFGDGTDQVSTVNPTHEFPDNATSGYLVTLYGYSPIGCIDSFTQVIQVNEEVIYYIPNTFTPDGDEFNQTFQPIFTAGFDPFDWRMLIYNRYGEVIWESSDPTEGWDGTYNGRMVQDGTYVWTVEFKTIASDERRTDTGHVNVTK